MASIRRTAAKAQQASREDSSLSSGMQPVSLFSEKKKHRETLAGEMDTDVDDEMRRNSPRTSKPLSQGSSHTAGGPRPQVPRAAQRFTESKSSFDSGTREDHSAENHAAEFRHTLRKSVRKNFRSLPDGLPPTSLFGGTQPPAEMASHSESCPICLDPIPAGTDLHVTRCAHRFHAACYSRYHWTAPMSSRDRCPVCRTSQLAPDSLHPADSPAESVPVLGHPRGPVARERPSDAAPSRVISPLQLLSSLDGVHSPAHNLSREWGERQEADLGTALGQANPVLAQSPGLVTPWVHASSAVRPGEGRSLSAEGDWEDGVTAQGNRGSARLWEQGKDEEAAASRGGRGRPVAGDMSVMGARGTLSRAAGMLGVLSDEEVLNSTIDGFALPQRPRGPAAAGAGQQAARLPLRAREAESEASTPLERMDSAQLRRRIAAIREEKRERSPRVAFPPMSPLHLLTAKDRQQEPAPVVTKAVGERSRSAAEKASRSCSPGSSGDDLAIATYSVNDILDKELGDGPEILVSVGGAGAPVQKRCSSVRAAVAEVNRAGGSMHLLEGSHAWSGDATLRSREINATAAEGARLRGQVSARPELLAVCSVTYTSRRALPILQMCSGFLVITQSQCFV